MNIFAQDEMQLGDDLALTAGVKLERSSFSGLEILPNLRVAWQPNERTLFWAAVSSAVRKPSRKDRQLQALPVLARATDVASERLKAMETGHRGQHAGSNNL